jgi:GTPase Era involved in 16S rRNA processing
MLITSYQKRLELVAWAEGIIKIAEQRGDKVAAQQIRKEIDDYLSGRFMLAVLGKVKRGKSTFCNAFLGRTDDLLAPVNRQPATSVFSKFFWGETESCNVYFRDGHCEAIPNQCIKDYVLEESNKENKKNVDCIEVIGPFSGLDKDLTLVDTPGAGSIHEHHDALLLGFLPQADAAIFLVTADQPIAKDELDLLQRLKAHDIKKIFFAINKVDDPNTDEDEIAEGIEHNRKMLNSVGIPVDKIYRISALKAMQGQKQESGFKELFADISTFLAENKLKILQAKFIARVVQNAEGLADGLAVEIASNSKGESQLAAELSQLRQEREKLSKNQEQVEQVFQRQWRLAVDKFAITVEEAEESVKSKAAKKISETGITAVSSLAREFPRYLSNLLESELDDGAVVFERESREAVETLRLEYPRIMMGKNSGEVIIRSGDSTTQLLKGSVAGASVAAVGYGLATVAGTTAASIAAANAAAIAAATTTVTAAGLHVVIGTQIGGLIGGLLSWLGTGTMTVAAAPVLTTTPIWLAIAGPVGWTLAGVGALAIPFAYRSSKLKLKDQLETACLDHIKTVFKKLKSERIPALKKMAEQIVEEHQTKLEHDLSQLETAIQNAIARKGTDKDIREMEALAGELNHLLQRG